MRRESNILIVGDRVLIRPDSPTDRTPHGLYLPPSVGEKEQVQTGHIIKVGPGYPIPNPNFTDDEPWAPNREPARYIPLQALVGDHALFLRKEAIEIEFNGEQLLIVPQPALLMLVREELHEEPEL
ncbi:MAG: co-chaperone GroES [Bacteroidetes bacterium]|nr:co-chaperone GroES [Bacteroidota bacterium]